MASMEEYSNVIHLRVEIGGNRNCDEEFIFVADNSKLRVYGRYSLDKDFEEVEFACPSWNFYGEAKNGDVHIFRPLKHEVKGFLESKGLARLITEST